MELAVSATAIGVRGGCLCGAVRYVIQGEPIAAVHCHCRDCRRATGAPFSTLAIYPRDTVAWAGAPVRRVAWADRLRLSCPACGAPLGILPAEDAAIIVITAGSLDSPEALKPACHVWTEDRLPWVKLADELPAYPRGMPA